jgi:hypothetical protein
MVSGRPNGEKGTLRILAVTQSLWGQRIAENVRAQAPEWEVMKWPAPRMLPPVIDDPDDFLPESLPQADLLLALAETPGMAQLVPDIARLCGARSVIAPVDLQSAMPKGLERQVQNWLEADGVAAVFPRPFCSLTEESYNRPPLTRSYDDPLIRQFAMRFGRPEFRINTRDQRVTTVEITRHASCGSTLHLAENLPGVLVSEAVDEAGMLHHHFPCMASMDIDSDYQDTLMHVSGNIVRDRFREALERVEPRSFIRPHGHVM